MTTTVYVSNNGPNDVLVKTKDTGNQAYPDETLVPGKFTSRHIFDTRILEVIEIPVAKKD